MNRYRYHVRAIFAVVTETLPDGSEVWDVVVKDTAGEVRTIYHAADRHDAWKVCDALALAVEAGKGSF